MDQNSLNKIAPDVKNILMHSKDFSYVSQYIPKFIDLLEDNDDWDTLFNRINKSTLSNNTSAEDFAHFVISVLTGTVAVDLYLKHLVNNNVSFEIQDRKGYIDRVYFNTELPAVLQPDSPEIRIPLCATTGLDTPLVFIKIRFMWTYRLEQEYLNQIIWVQVQAPSSKQTHERYCKVKELNDDLIWKCLLEIKW